MTRATHRQIAADSVSARLADHRREPALCTPHPSPGEIGAMQTHTQHGLALENAARRDRGLPELTLEQYVAAGYRYPAAPPPATRAANARTGPVLDAPAIYEKLNTPAMNDRDLPAIDSRADGESFAAAIFARANARHGTLPRRQGEEA
jgi:hypothetical protein